MKPGLIRVALTVAAFTGIAAATEITDRKTSTLGGARRKIAAVVAQAHKNYAGVSSLSSMTAAIWWRGPNALSKRSITYGFAPSTF